MAPNRSPHDTLNALQNAGAQKVTNLMVQLQNAGLDKVISVPQMVMCGDQSSGKSSVIEALTGIPFPHDQEMCTRFAMEAVLGSSDKTSATVEIVPASDRSVEDVQRLLKFSRPLNSYSELQTVIDKASLEMGLKPHDSSSSKSRSFGRHKLRILITGPQLPNLLVHLLFFDTVR